MITLITTWVTERIITVITVTLLTVAAVPTTLVLVTQHHGDEDTRVVVIQAVKDEGHRTITLLQNAEASCTSQITTVVTTYQEAGTAPKVQTAVTQGTGQVHASVATFILAVQKEEDEIDKITVVTPEIEHTLLDQIHTIQVVALGDGHTVGVVTITCETVVIRIQEVIEIVVIHHIEDDDDD